MKIIKNTWVFEFSPRARAEFKKLDKDIQKRIQKCINKMINSEVNPKNQWKQLCGNLHNLYSYRLGTYRILAEIKNSELKILAVSIGHRREIYKNV